MHNKLKLTCTHAHVLTTSRTVPHTLHHPHPHPHVFAGNHGPCTRSANVDIYFFMIFCGEMAIAFTRTCFANFYES